MQMAKYSCAFNSPQLYILNSSLKKTSAITVVCDYKNVNVQTPLLHFHYNIGNVKKHFNLSFLS